MNLHEKLLEIRKSCEYLKKDNSGYQFSYVSSSQTLGTLRGKMDELGVLLVPSVISFEVRDHTTKKGDHEYFTIIYMDMRWVDAANPEDFISCNWLGQGLDSGEKGVGKAVTYSEKYFMLKFFNIATDKDDPDRFQKKHEAGKKATPTSKPITDNQRKKLYAMCKSEDVGFSDTDVKGFVDYILTLEEVENMEEDGKKKLTSGGASYIFAYDNRVFHRLKSDFIESQVSS